jgi:hypothetical protein
MAANSTSIVPVTEGDEMSESKAEATESAPASAESAEQDAADQEAAEQATTASVLATIAGRSEEAVRKVYGDLSENPRMQDAKERLGKASNSVLAQLNIASQDDLSALRDEIARLEQRLAVPEKAVGSGSKTRKDAPSA